MKLRYCLTIEFPDTVKIDPARLPGAIADTLHAQALHGVPRVFPDSGIGLAPGDLSVSAVHLPEDGEGDLPVVDGAPPKEAPEEAVMPAKGAPLLAMVPALLAACALLFGVGCASLTTKQESIAPDGSSRSTTARVSTFWDSKSELAKLRTTMTDKSQGVGIAGLEQESSATNAVSLIESVVGAAVRAATK